MYVEMDEPAFEIYEDPVPKETRRRLGVRHGREALLSTGSVANKQHLRKSSRKKPPKEVGTNILKTTGSMMSKTVSGAVRTTMRTSKGAFGLVRGSTGQLRRIVRKLGKQEEENKGDKLHKFLYDLHSGAKFEAESVSSDENSDYVAIQRQSWTHLSSLLVDPDQREQYAGAAHKRVLDENTYQERIDGGAGGHGQDGKEVTTIEEITVISACAQLPMDRGYEKLQRPIQTNLDEGFDDVNVAPGVRTMANYVQDLAMTLDTNTSVNELPVTINARVPSVDESTKASDPSRGSLDTISLSFSQGVDLTRKPSVESLVDSTPFPKSEPISSPAQRSLRQLSTVSQDMFNLTDAMATYYSPKTDPIKISSVSLASVPPQAEITRPSSLHSTYCDEKRSSSERSIYSHRSSSSMIFPAEKTRHVSYVSAFHEPSESHSRRNSGGVDTQSQGQGKSVRERVKELDMAIDQAMGFTREKGRKTSIFARWKN